MQNVASFKTCRLLYITDNIRMVDSLQQFCLLIQALLVNRQLFGCTLAVDLLHSPRRCVQFPSSGIGLIIKLHVMRCHCIIQLRNWMELICVVVYNAVCIMLRLYSNSLFKIQYNPLCLFSTDSGENVIYIKIDGSWGTREDKPVHQVNVDSSSTAQLLHEGWSWDGDWGPSVAGKFPNADVLRGLECSFSRRRHSVQEKRQNYPASIRFYFTQALYMRIHSIVLIYTIVNAVSSRRENFRNNAPSMVSWSLNNVERNSIA